MLSMDQLPTCMCLQVFFSTFFGASYKAYLQILQKAYYQSYQVKQPCLHLALFV